MTLKNVLVPIADGSEEIETSIIIDVLRRAGANVVVASVSDNLEIVASRKMKIVADALLKDVHNKHQWDLITLPGGMPGADNLSKCSTLITLLNNQKESNRLYGAICASPAVVLAQHNLLNEKATSYPSHMEKLGNKAVASKDQRVVVDGNCVTSQGPGTSFDFVLTLVQLLYGEEKATTIEKGSHCLIEGSFNHSCWRMPGNTHHCTLKHHHHHID
ncbi:hypothetical protein SAMD00019534_017670, partial [Acytostelium subglobosum LB1]|uniref:hypothetical protein n=1 Tax=Acytostelium subglobosum LB1 TaxID=1410327 RepID=UPI000644E4DA